MKIYRNKQEHKTHLTYILLRAFADIYPEATKNWQETEKNARFAV